MHLRLPNAYQNKLYISSILVKSIVLFHANALPNYNANLSVYQMIHSFFMHNIAIFAICQKESGDDVDGFLIFTLGFACDLFGTYSNMSLFFLHCSGSSGDSDCIVYRGVYRCYSRMKNGFYG